MREDERLALRRRFRFRCGYCGVCERDAGAELTVDHFQPRSKAGKDVPENWVYCCHACNEFKGDYWEPVSVQQILHPFRNNLADHVTEEPDGTLRGLTATGAFHIERLHLNRGPLVALRKERQREKSLKREDAIQKARLQNLLKRVRSIIAKIRQSKSDK